jgi:hypothetical protein
MFGVWPLRILGERSVQSLLIIRTGRIVTVFDGSAGCSGFPAFSRIYRQRVSTVSRV